MVMIRRHFLSPNTYHNDVLIFIFICLAAGAYITHFIYVKAESDPTLFAFTGVSVVKYCDFFSFLSWLFCPSVRPSVGLLVLEYFALKGLLLFCV